MAADLDMAQIYKPVSLYHSQSHESDARINCSYRSVNMCREYVKG